MLIEASLRHMFDVQLPLGLPACFQLLANLFQGLQCTFFDHASRADRNLCLAMYHVHACKVGCMEFVGTPYAAVQDSR